MTSTTELKETNSQSTDPVDIPTATPAENEENNDDEAETKKCCERSAACYKKLALLLVLVAFIVYLIIDRARVRDGVFAFLEWIENNVVAGVFVFIAVYFVATVFFIPGSILTLGAGFVFSAALGLGQGVALGTAAVWVGASAGAIAAFVLGRYIARESVAPFLDKYIILKALDNAFREKGLLVMVLLRLSPIVPFSITNYVMGATGITLWEYSVACVAMLPGTVAYVFLGASLGSLTELAGDDEAEEEEGGGNRTTLIAGIVGAVFVVAFVAVISYYGKKELDKIIDQQKAEEDETNEDNNDDDEETGKNDDDEDAKSEDVSA